MAYDLLIYLITFLSTELLVKILIEIEMFGRDKILNGNYSNGFYKDNRMYGFSTFLIIEILSILGFFKLFNFTLSQLANLSVDVFT